MPVSHDTSVFAVKDAKIRKVTADAAGAITYGPSVDVPGIKSVSISGDITTAELRGDNRRLDFRSILGGISVEFEYAKLSLDALAVLLGGTVADTGTAPNQVASFSITGSESFSFFQFEAVSAGSDAIAGEVVMRLNKCILSEFPDLGMEEEDYATVTVAAEAVKPLATASPWLEVIHRETAVALT